MTPFHDMQLAQRLQQEVCQQIVCRYTCYKLSRLQVKDDLRPEAVLPL